jgi:porphobilinogen synthase
MLSTSSDCQGAGPSSNRALSSVHVRLTDLTDTKQKRDVQEGADIIMVKPGLPYLDIIQDASELAEDHPLAVYQVSGEYAMIVHGANAGVYNLRAMAFETTEAYVRAGCNLILSYFTPQFLEWLEV